MTVRRILLGISLVSAFWIWSWCRPTSKQSQAQTTADPVHEAEPDAIGTGTSHTDASYRFRSNQSRPPAAPSPSAAQRDPDCTSSSTNTSQPAAMAAIPHPRTMVSTGKVSRMRDALVADIARIDGVEVIVFHDDDAPVDRERFRSACRAADWTFLIAPETNDCLASLADSALAAGGRLLGPSPAAIRLASDKFALFQHWQTHAVRTPATTEHELTDCEAFPVVWKPRDGAGSMWTFLLRSANDVVRAKAILAQEADTGPMILQEYVPGLAASVAFLCGPAGYVPLLPANQSLSDDGRFTYCGGKIPLPYDLARRAVQLGQRAVDCVPGLLGYVGVDLVLGAAGDGSCDYAIEINPRLTTSYVGLRQLAEDNLAELMLAQSKAARSYHVGKPDPCGLHHVTRNDRDKTKQLKRRGRRERRENWRERTMPILSVNGVRRREHQVIERVVFPSCISAFFSLSRFFSAFSAFSAFKTDHTTRLTMHFKYAVCGQLAATGWSAAGPRRSRICRSRRRSLRHLADELFQLAHARSGPVQQHETSTPSFASSWSAS